MILTLRLLVVILCKEWQADGDEEVGYGMRDEGLVLERT